MGTLLIRLGSEQVVESFGNATLEPLSQNTESTVYFTASLSKQVTAAAVLKLIELEKMKLNTEVRSLFPELNPSLFSRGGVPVTIHHLLSHTSGLPDIYQLQPVKTKLFREKVLWTDISKALNSSKLSFVPGQEWNYSNTGYILLGEIIRRATATSYGSFVQTQLFQNKISLSLERPIRYSSEPLIVKGNRLVNFLNFHGVKVFHDGDLFTDGNIYASVSSLADWVKSLANGSLLSKELTKKMFQPYKENYGYGWIIKKRSNKETLYFHNGSFLGFTGDVYHIPERDLTIIWLRNKEGDSHENSKLCESILESTHKL